MTRRLLPLLLLSAALPGCSKSDGDLPKANAPVAAVAAPAGKSWVDTVVATPEGGFRMGNPQAAVQLVEYGSFTCPHCKRFEAEGLPAIKRDYVASGRVSYEFRPFLIHSPDPMASILVACRGAATYFPLSEQVYGAQDTWLNKLVAVPAKVQEGWQSLGPVEQMKAMATASGLKAFLAARGLSPAAADKCLSDPLAPSRLVAVRDHATNDLNFNGTPAFFINGQQVEDAVAWSQLEPHLKNAVG